jgi:hypothetical protein
LKLSNLFVLVRQVAHRELILVSKISFRNKRLTADENRHVARYGCLNREIQSSVSRISETEAGSRETVSWALESLMPWQAGWLLRSVLNVYSCS